MAPRPVPLPRGQVTTANHAIDVLKAAAKGLDALDVYASREAQGRHDAITALAIAQEALFGAM